MRKMTEHQLEILIACVLSIFVVPMLFGLLWLTVSAIEGIGLHRMEHDRCLKNATNGYEIRECR